MKRLLALALAMAAILAACGLGGEYADAGDAEICFIFNDGSEGDGKGLKRVINPEDKPSKVDAGDEYVSCVPTSDRFWANVENEQQRDAGAAPHFIALSSDGFEMIAQTKAEFVFNIITIPDWVKQHLIRNTENGHTACPVGVSPPSDECQTFAPYDMGFNARDGLVSAWIRWLIGKYETQMSQAVKLTTARFDRAHLQFDYPVGANSKGELPKNATNEDKRLTSEVYAEMLSETFTRLLNENLGASNGEEGNVDYSYFCGVGHNQNTPEECDPILVRVPERITAVNTTFVAEREKVENEKEAAANAAELEEIAGQRQATEKARLDRESRARVEAEARRLAEEAAAAEELEKSGANVARRQKIELNAFEEVAPCVVLGITDGFQCAALIGRNLPEYFGSGEGSNIFSPTPSG